MVRIPPQSGLKMFPELSDEERLHRAKEMIKYLYLHGYNPETVESVNFLNDLTLKYNNENLNYISEKQYKWLKDIFEES